MNRKWQFGGFLEDFTNFRPRFSWPRIYNPIWPPKKHNCVMIKKVMYWNLIECEGPFAIFQFRAVSIYHFRDTKTLIFNCRNWFYLTETKTNRFDINLAPTFVLKRRLGTSRKWLIDTHCMLLYYASWLVKVSRAIFWTNQLSRDLTGSAKREVEAKKRGTLTVDCEEKNNFTPSICRMWIVLYVIT